MTTPQPPQDSNPKPPSPATPPEAAKKTGEPPAPKKGTSYVFKIAPADPKTSFDFEDVADK
jgi:hypothetical protein